jgi:tRNA threonylcarbamoyladenosine biosynthesis protein TsaB
MNILALDTSMGACSVALLRASSSVRVLFTRHRTMQRGHAEALLPLLAEVMEESRSKYSDIELIAATTGPGSFTGVRIAIAAAQGLALVTKAKLYGTDSLAVMTKTALADLTPGGGPFAVAVDARRSMLYFGVYEESGKTREGPLLLSPKDAADLLPDDVHAAVGSGAELLAEAARKARKRVEAKLPELQPSAGALAEMAYRARDLARDVSDVLLPLYLRPADAKPQTPLVELAGK